MAENKKTEVEKKEKKITNSSKIVIASSIVIVIIALVIAGYFYTKYQRAQNLLKDPTIAAQQQTQDLINKVGMLIDLPNDEQPTIATVSDITKLKDQPFFKNAKNGDKVLIYTKAKKAILYDPIANKIIEVAPVNIGQNIEITPSPTTVGKKPAPTTKITTTTTPTPSKEQ